MSAARAGRASRLPRTGFRAKILLLASALVFLLLLALAGEGLCRLFAKQHLLGNSRNLFAPGVWGESKGNAPEVEAISFGTRIWTDRHGFRVPPPDRRVERPAERALLILGDSVAFGPGVPEERTLAGLLRLNLPSLTVYNSAVVGYWTGDYLNVVRHFLPAHEEVRRVVLVLCLNDVETLSAREIDAALAASGGKRLSWFTRLREFGPAKPLNDFLRARSKLYLVAKHAASQPRRWVWESTAAAYADPRLDLAAALAPVVEIDRLLRERGIPFTVILSPYAHQVEVASAESEAPQRRLAAHLAGHGVDVVDALPAFRSSGLSTDELFLVHDPMHLAEAGHALVYRMVRDLPQLDR